MKVELDLRRKKEDNDTRELIIYLEYGNEDVWEHREIDDLIAAVITLQKKLKS